MGAFFIILKFKQNYLYFLHAVEIIDKTTEVFKIV